MQASIAVLCDDSRGNTPPHCAKEPARERQEIAVGEVDDVTQIQNQRKSERHQHIEGTDYQAVGDVELNDLRHLPPFRLPHAAFTPL